MKPAVEWTEEDILNLPVGEHDWFETKGRRTIDLTLDGVKEHEARERLSKEVSAFANTGGGVLVLGVPDQKYLSEPRKIDDGGVSLVVRKPNTKEWLENWISTLVDPPLNAFNVYVVTRQDDPSQIGTDQGVFLVDIQDSPDAPHQATDNKYYIRAASRSLPARHQTVSDIFNRHRHPVMDVSLALRTGRLHKTVFSQDNEMVSRLVVTVSNEGRVLAQYVNVIVDIPEAVARLQIADDDFWEFNLVSIDGESYIRNFEDNSNSSMSGMGYQRATLYEPILPGLSYTLEVDVPLPQDVWLQAKVWDLHVRWEVYADNAPPRSGAIEVSELRPESYRKSG